MGLRLTRLLGLLGSFIVFATIVFYGPLSQPSPIPLWLAVDVAALAIAVPLVAFGRLWENRWARWVPWIASGALIGATAMGPLLVAPWITLAAISFAVAGATTTLRRRRWLLGGLTIALASAALNFLFIYNRLLGDDMRLAPTEFLSKDFRVNVLLADVPIHDVWVFHLQGGGSDRSLADVQALTARQRPTEINTTVAGLVGLRMLFGNVFGWDDDRHFDLATSYIGRLGPDDRANSLEEPGTRHGIFRTVYRFENESLAELMNATAHAFFCVAIEPADDGYTLYWAIYVREMRPFTKLYMSLIDPFRRLLVYPTMVERIEQRWAERYAGVEP